MKHPTSVVALARTEIQDLHGYRATVPDRDSIKLHANEAPFVTGTKEAQGINRYPNLRPEALGRMMAVYYGVKPDNILVTRGSSEGIDVLLRSFCAARRDNILVTPPTFELFRVFASIQGAGITSVPLQQENDFSLDTDALLNACSDSTKLVFLCSPNNPVGSVIPKSQVLQILDARASKSVVVFDEAYVEFSSEESLAPLVSEYSNLVVLRTLSKAHALAGARCGAVIAPPEVIQLLSVVMQPYAVASPVVASAELALGEKKMDEARESIRTIVAERERLQVRLAACCAVARVWKSHANFLFVKFRNPEAIKTCLEDRHIQIRFFTNNPELESHARITVASAEHNDQVIRAIECVE